MKMKKYWILVCCLFLLTACNPKKNWPGWSEGNSLSYIPTDTPSDEPYETSTPVPTPDQTQEVLQVEFLNDVYSYLEEYKEVSGDIKSIVFVRINPSTGYFEIKFVTSTTVFEIQPMISFRLMQSISHLFASEEFREEFKDFTNANDFYIDLTTVANDRDRYEFNSVTGWELMEGLSNKSISFQEWKQGSNAGFVP